MLASMLPKMGLRSWCSVNLVGDDEKHEVGVAGVGLLGDDNVPLLRRRDDNFEALSDVSDHFRR